MSPKFNLCNIRLSCLPKFSVIFSSGTTISIKQGDADSIIRLLNLYERKEGESCIL
ncbi:hypothetical protein EVA_19514 [gut metagenome]|uniref:Uncharacterized protein n=1 Tax=gut metagenome TaxID=749906 RepID=J9BXT2_9ZZZZ